MAHQGTLRSTAVRLGAVVLLAAGVVMAVLAMRAGGAEASSPSLQVSVPAQVRVGEPIVISMTLRQANDIAGYETRVLFDTSVANLRGMEQRNNELRKLGRDVQPLGPIQIDGGVVLGAYSCPYASCVAPAGKPNDRAGRGTVRLATFSLVSYTPGTLTIRLDGTRFVDAAGNPVSVNLGTTTFTVQVIGA